MNNTADAVTEAANGGSDTVLATVSYTLPAEVEALYLVGTGLTGTGTGGADTLVTLGASTLAGAGGNDTFVFVSGQANGASVADFDGQGAGQGDYLIFSGFGTAAQDATFTSLGHDRVANSLRPRRPQQDHHVQRRAARFAEMQAAALVLQTV